ncbi:uncharacterized protein LOC129694835, partial [Leucoraja erinacea]|uniref:uncharacterized protein LOC129694835 n=1 Tax=Leucoraja erinaceus TaxID=7782 RepID=UPI002457E185
MVAGHPVNVTCSFNTTCNGTTPTLTWVTPTGEPPSASHRVTQWGDTWTYTSVLSLTPALKHHGQNLSCRVTYPNVSSSQILTLNVQCKYGHRLLCRNSNNPLAVLVRKVINSRSRSKPFSPSSLFHHSMMADLSLPHNYLPYPRITESAAKLVAEFYLFADAPQNLIITSPNNMHSSWVSIKQGNSAVILCSVQSFPASNLTWEHLSVTLNTTCSGNELRMEFPQLTRQDYYLNGI